jgi:SAM-dependent methyltransferase
MVGHLQRHAQLQPHDRVLDVGCGIGRVALPLLHVVEPPGSYDGFDIVPHAIRWCTEHISANAPHFRFVLADVFNGDYNPRGREAAARYRFPYESAAFDVVFATSVFTHMPAAEVGNYLREIARVLAPGGRCLITWFLLNDESRAMLQAGKAVLDFRHPVEHGLSIDARNPERAIAYDESFVTTLYEHCGLVLQRPLLPGQWCGRAAFVSGQDMCVAVKR